MRSCPAGTACQPFVINARAQRTGAARRVPPAAFLAAAVRPFGFVPFDSRTTIRRSCSRTPPLAGRFWGRPMSRARLDNLSIQDLAAQRRRASTPTRTASSRSPSSPTSYDASGRRVPVSGTGRPRRARRPRGRPWASGRLRRTARRPKVASSAAGCRLLDHPRLHDAHRSRGSNRGRCRHEGREARLRAGSASEQGVTACGTSAGRGPVSASCCSVCRWRCR